MYLYRFIAIGLFTVFLSPTAFANSFVCDGRVKMEVNSLKLEGRGTVVMDATYENLGNHNMRMAVYYGGASGKNTYLVSDTGEMWPKVKKYKGGGGTHGIVFIPGIKMKVKMKFKIRSGGQDARSFYLTNWVNFLSEKGMTGPDEYGWCKIEIPNLQLSQ